MRPDDFVLEIGSGHNPKARSDVLCDKFITDDEQRGGRIVADRPIVERGWAISAVCRPGI